ncbi:MAG: hypothetical protein FD123_4113 [Bacteroidetes bacterium]|nr:MAG: hypothetical protein FD123_4113 [Bacteroidota bacterium]
MVSNTQQRQTGARSNVNSTGAKGISLSAPAQFKSREAGEEELLTGFAGNPHAVFQPPVQQKNNAAYHASRQNHTGAISQFQRQSSAVVQRVIDGDDFLTQVETDMGTSSFWSRGHLENLYSGNGADVTDFFNGALTKDTTDLTSINEKNWPSRTGDGTYYCTANRQLPVDANGGGARAFYGFNNPAKTSANGQEIMLKGIENMPAVETAMQGAGELNDPTATFAAQSVANRAYYLRTYGTFECQRTHQAGLGWDDCILGHDDTVHTGASGYFNDAGHGDDGATNGVWNRDPANYWGPEETAASLASAAAAPRYRTPLNEIGSHDDWT